MDLSKKESPSAKTFRKRIMREDDMLQSRTSVFLITNGLLLATFGISDDTLIRSIISLLGIIVTVSWALTSWQNWRVIKDLTIDYRMKHNRNYIENIVQNAMFKPGWRRPTDLIAKLLPFTFLTTWLILLVLHLLKLIRVLVFF